MPSLFDKIQAKLELYRLEKRYTRNRNRRTTFISGAVYVDGEYVYNTPNSTGSSAQSSAASSPTTEYGRHSVEEARSRSYTTEPQTPAQRKKLNRFSSMPGFGSLTKTNQQDWRSNTVDVHEVR
ncbi:hypothetical protein JX265_009524 [Neoarthrinium moseri]|uniref:Uncharacterized protein n=1 Tax=Neoarthrinium moseri TaxID=1658444 RepID=A0A9P9WG60_9PEZI|nr:uncharacterized protein JN550_010680 [Neoarthrinium moseri]KAI1844901.1 hypothetical protein JX266_008917 [Neoarthrinium moseri]KAI1861557.1 hypothetical protein JX265_009524 [Neoarthrinium moseri]KAI1861740.1 hypothetical protein JN550_010680 [Neoarthrinium moseri]